MDILYPLLHVIRILMSQYIANLSQFLPLVHLHDIQFFQNAQNLHHREIHVVYLLHRIESLSKEFGTDFILEFGKVKEKTIDYAYIFIVLKKLLIDCFLAKLFIIYTRIFCDILAQFESFCDHIHIFLNSTFTS